VSNSIESIKFIVDEHVRKVLEKYKYNIRLCAMKLGVCETTLITRMKRLKIAGRNSTSYIPTIHKANIDESSINKVECRNITGIHNTSTSDNWIDVTCKRCLSKKRKQEQKSGRLQ